MKNIYLLPTDKPSRLHTYKGVLNIAAGEFVAPTIVKNDLINQNIYITSDEEIKEGDWGFDGLHIFKCLKPFIANETTSGKNIPCFYIELDGKSNTFHETSYIKKIILTTDVALIKDGVQSINDEFLEWFVKNPSCEEVEVNDWLDTDGNIAFGGDKRYQICNHLREKIIIPKEEHKKICENCKVEISKWGCGCGKKEEPN